jgi:hypothetical protein
MVSRSGLAASAVALVLAMIAQPLWGASDPVTITFDQAPPGSLPAPFRALSSSEAEPGLWRVTRVDGVPALTQDAIGRSGYRLAVIDAARFEHVRVGGRLRVAGRGDRSGGVAWRIQDAGNYYAVRLDLSERQLLLYKFVNGNRVRLSQVEGLRLDERAWHEVVVEHTGDTIRVWLNGVPIGRNRDGTLRRAGTIALWTPGDSSCHFSKVWYESLRAD